MIQFAIPKAYVDNPELDLPTGAPKTQSEGEGELFSSFLATYLGELGHSKGLHFGLEENLELDEDEQTIEPLEASKIAWAIYNLGLPSQSNVAQEGEDAISSISSQDQVDVLPTQELSFSTVDCDEEVMSTVSTENLVPLEQAEVGNLLQTQLAVGEGEMELAFHEVEKATDVVEQSLVGFDREVTIEQVAQTVFKAVDEPNLNHTVFASVIDEKQVVKNELFPTSLRQSTQTKIRHALESLGLEDASQPTVVDEQVETLFEPNEIPARDELNREDSSVVPSTKVPEEFSLKSDLVKGNDQTTGKIVFSLEGDFEEVEVQKAQEKHEVGNLSSREPIETTSTEPRNFDNPIREHSVVKPKRLEANLENSISLDPPNLGPSSILNAEEDVVPTQSKPVLDLRMQESVLPKITKQIETLIQNERTEVRIQLKPEHLGEMKIKLSLERGIMQGEFVVENEAVREVIASQLPQLETALQEQGANVAQMMVNIDFGQSRSEDQDKARPKHLTSQTGGKTPVGASSPSQTNRLSKSPWYKVDLKA